MSQITYGVEDTYARPARFEVPLTGFAITGTSESLLVIVPAGTLATGAFTLPLNPQDGQQWGVVSTQTQTACTVAANTGDTVSAPAVTALVAGTAVRWVYRLSNRTWYRA